MHSLMVTFLLQSYAFLVLVFVLKSLKSYVRCGVGAFLRRQCAWHTCVPPGVQACTGNGGFFRYKTVQCSHQYSPEPSHSAAAWMCRSRAGASVGLPSWSGSGRLPGRWVMPRHPDSQGRSLHCLLSTNSDVSLSCGCVEGMHSTRLQSGPLLWKCVCLGGGACAAGRCRKVLPTWAGPALHH